jgi:hypothetical protein
MVSSVDPAIATALIIMACCSAAATTLNTFSAPGRTSGRRRWIFHVIEEADDVCFGPWQTSFSFLSHLPAAKLEEKKFNAREYARRSLICNMLRFVRRTGC